MKHKTSQILFAYWDELRGSRRAPKRVEIDPAQISKILPETMMLEITAPASYRFRIAGTRLCEQLGMELRGLNFLALWKPTDQRRMEDGLRATACQGQISSFSIESKTSSSGQPVTSELILLPLTNVDGEINRFMGAWSTAQSTDWAGSSYLRDHQIADPEAITTTKNTRPSDQPPSLSPLSGYKRLVTSERRRFRVYDGGLS